MSITNTGRVLWFHQTSHRNRVTIKVSLGTRKVLVEAHGSRVGFVHPDDGEIYSGPSRWYHIDIACKHVTGSRECYITWTSKEYLSVTRSNEVWLIPMIGSRTSKISWDKRNWLRRWWLTRSLVHRWMSGSHYGSPDPADDYWSEKCLDHVHIVHEP